MLAIPKLEVDVKAESSCNGWKCCFSTSSPATPKNTPVNEMIVEVEKTVIVVEHYFERKTPQHSPKHSPAAGPLPTRIEFKDIQIDQD